jgi:hypothetical protein
MPTTPAVATSRTKIRSNGFRRRSRGGNMFCESARAVDAAAAPGPAALGPAAVGSLDRGILGL